jgi:hypothetical protein
MTRKILSTVVDAIFLILKTRFFPGTLAGGGNTRGCRKKRMDKKKI